MGPTTRHGPSGPAWQPYGTAAGDRGPGDSGSFTRGFGLPRGTRQSRLDRESRMDGLHGRWNWVESLFPLPQRSISGPWLLRRPSGSAEPAVREDARPASMLACGRHASAAWERSGEGESRVSNSARRRRYPDRCGGLRPDRRARRVVRGVCGEVSRKPAASAAPERGSTGMKSRESVAGLRLSPLAGNRGLV